MKKLTLGLCLVTTNAALAHNFEYKVCKGDTLSTIATKFHVPARKILHANDLMPDHHMRPGHFLLIPGVSDSKKVVTVRGKSARSGAKSERTGRFAYKVRNGDQDWSLAKKRGISLHALHVANPDVDWDHLQLGSTVYIPTVPVGGSIHKGPAVRVASHAHVAHSDGSVHMKAHWHVVEGGENDWVIAHKAGIRVGLLKSLNPQNDLADLRPGQRVRVPGSAVSRLAMSVHVIHSSHVAVSGDNVTIRRSPSTDGDSICTIDQGIRAAVVDRHGSWYQLKFPKGTVGWVRGDLLKPVHVIEVAENEPRRHREHSVEHVAQHHVSHFYHAEPARHHIVEAPRYHHRSVEHTSSTTYTAMDKNAGSEKDAPDAQSVLHDAHQMRGTRYSWGSASRSATDCSGFTSQVFKRNGIKLPRTSYEQATVGEPVSRANLKPGDLIFFHTRGGSHRVSHVVIYEGDNKFIHASSRGHRVQEGSLSEAYYSNHFVSARRVLRHHGHRSSMVASASHEVKAEKATAAPAIEPKASDDAPTSVTAR